MPSVWRARRATMPRRMTPTGAEAIGAHYFGYHFHRVRGRAAAEYDRDGDFGHFDRRSIDFAISSASPQPPCLAGHE